MKKSNSSVYEVCGVDENEDMIFALCTSRELAEAAIKKMVEGDWEADDLCIKKSNLRLNEIIQDNVHIDLNALIDSQEQTI